MLKNPVGIRLKRDLFIRASQALRLDDVCQDTKNRTGIGMVNNIAAQHPARDPRERTAGDTRISQYLLPDQQGTA